MLFSTCLEPIKDSSCRINLQAKRLRPTKCPSYTCLWTRRDGNSTRSSVSCSFWSFHNLFFSFLFRQCCFKSQGRLKDYSSLQQHSIFTTGTLGVHWRIAYFDITRQTSSLGSARKTVFRNSHTISTVLFYFRLVSHTLSAFSTWRSVPHFKSILCWDVQTARGTPWRSWQCATSRKVTVSIHEQVLEFFVHLFLPAALWPLCRLRL